MKTTYKIILVFSLIILSILSYKLSAKKIKSDINLPALKFDFNLHNDIEYKNNSLTLDIYQPKTSGKGKSPVVVYVHGGAWDKGDKTMIRQNFREYILEELLKNNYTVVSINYTLLNKETHLEKPLQDTKDALKWIQDNADKYNMDTQNMGIWGGSAGAHIALMTAYNQDVEKNNSDLTYPNLKYVVDFYGPTDLNELFKTEANGILLNLFKIYSPKRFQTRHDKIRELTGFDINTNKKEVVEKSTAFSPIKYVSKTTVPTLIFHGTGDTVVNFAQSQQLEEALKKNKIPYQLHAVENAKHTFGNITLNEAKDVSKKTVDFIKSHTSYVN
ncbi:alpha/beta hydrolase [Epilithonimonas sp. JDS]|uniref:alpha/beta hydrolase n=1 Tax=Epilithonimonas sp. JDS TaxID=2902797 RepID=UPI001E5CDFB5|nr:alpha/beta hydrolase [Epilithonimonas sp. JDS]MCD9854540.1 alpha/beta hydrolase [Epilithonimonas sp. JDS]